MANRSGMKWKNGRLDSEKRNSNVKIEMNMSALAGHCSVAHLFIAIVAVDHCHRGMDALDEKFNFLRDYFMCVPFIFFFLVNKWMQSVREWNKYVSLLLPSPSIAIHLIIICIWMCNVCFVYYAMVRWWQRWQFSICSICRTERGLLHFVFSSLLYVLVWLLDAFLPAPSLYDLLALILLCDSQSFSFCHFY